MTSSTPPLPTIQGVLRQTLFRLYWPVIRVETTRTARSSRRIASQMAHDTGRNRETGVAFERCHHRTCIAHGNQQLFV